MDVASSASYILLPASQGNQDRLKYLVLAPILSGESRCTGGTGYGRKTRDVKYLNTVCSQHEKENRGGWRRKQDGGREVTECCKDDRNKETEKLGTKKETGSQK